MNTKDELNEILQNQHDSAKQGFDKEENMQTNYETEFILEEIFQHSQKFEIPIEEISLRIISSNINAITLSFNPNGPVTYVNKISINQIKSIPKLINALIEMGFVKFGKWYKYTFDDICTT